MKKILYFIPLIFLFIPFRVSASNYLPSVLPSSNATTSVELFQNQLLYDGLESLGVRVPNVEDYRNAFRIMTGRTEQPFNFNYKYVDLASADWFNDLDATLTDSNGNVVTQDNAVICFAESDLTANTFIYSKETGEILNIQYGDSELLNSLSGHITGEGWTNTHTIADPVLSGQQSAIYNPVTIDPDIEDYIENQQFGGYAITSSHDYAVYIPNGCSANVVCTPLNGNNDYSYNGNSYVNFPNYFATDDSGVFLMSTYPAWLTSAPRNNSYYGRSWTLQSRGTAEGLNLFYNGGVIRWKSPTQAQFNEIVGNSDEISDNVVFVFFVTPYSLPDEVSDQKLRTNPIKNYYTYTYNNDYSNDDTTNVFNFPISATTSNLPDYSPVTNLYNYYYTTVNTPSTGGGDVGNLPDGNTSLPDNIPILSNLEKRFPFSIPWDIKNMLSQLETTSQAPVFDLSFTIPVINYDWEMIVDLSAWDSTAELFRLLFLISFIIGLAVFSYSHFFGS